MARQVSRHVAEGKNRPRKKKEQPDMLADMSDELIEKLRNLQLFCTPPWATRAAHQTLIDVNLIDDCPKFILDPCAGLDHMATPLRQMGHAVDACDIEDYGYSHRIQNFLIETATFGIYDEIWMNPPFSESVGRSARGEQSFAERFVRKAQTLAPVVMVACRMSFIGSAGRHALFYENEIGNLRAFMPCSERPGMFLGRYSPTESSATDYAWYFFKRGYFGRPEVIPIPPGMRDRFQRPEDIDIHRGWNVS